MTPLSQFVLLACTKMIMNHTATPYAGVYDLLKTRVIGRESIQPMITIVGATANAEHKPVRRLASMAVWIISRRAYMMM